MFSPGETQKTVTVNVVGDTIDEPNEDLYMDLSNAANATIADSVATATIADDDAHPTLAIDDVSGTEADSGTLTATFTVTLTGATSQTVSVQFETADGTATHPDDFTASDGTLTFNIGQTQKTISVVVNSDDLYEADETYFVNVSSPENA